MREVECLVVGGGPAGLAAAHAAAGLGVQVVLVDENVQLGGQFYRQPPPQFRLSTPRLIDEELREGRRLINAVLSLGVEVRLASTVWGVFDGRTAAVASGDRAERISAKTLILAPGAYDRPVPFPGWTLPGVMTAGAAQNLMKGQEVVPGLRVLLAGSGPLLLVVAHNLIKRGVKVAAICEASSLRRLWPHAARLLSHWKLVHQGYEYWRTIRSAGVPLLPGHVITRASGSGGVQSGVVSRCDQQWRPLQGTEREFGVDAIVVGYGFVPSTQLSQLAGAEHRYREDLGYWIPVRTPEMESTVDGVFVVGDGGGVAGSLTALAEGRLVGMTVAHRLGKMPKSRFDRERAQLHRRLSHLAGFRAAMDSLYRFGSGIYTIADPETILCRCEEVTVHQALAVVTEGAASMNEVKILTQVGMGRCQGRLCGPPLAHLLGHATQRSVVDSGSFTQRIPAKPVSLGAIAGSE